MTNRATGFGSVVSVNALGHALSRSTFPSPKRRHSSAEEFHEAEEYRESSVVWIALLCRRSGLRDVRAVGAPDDPRPHPSACSGRPANDRGRISSNGAQ